MNLVEQNTSSATSFDLECVSISKSFNTFKAVDQISFQIPRGSFFSILGPSGCGKTTLLRMLAGFQHPDSGDIFIKGDSVLNTPPNKRPVNMVFQHLALFPTMTVAENIGYGLKRRGMNRHDQKPLIQDVLDRVGLPDSGNKRIHQLSGGQKQRIAIARCLILKPDVLLLDEPLGALDLKLREQMKIELKQLQQIFGTTFVYITHDQSEALVMSDQVAVMNHGRFEQVSTPQELYYHPATSFVASFVGDSNCWVGTIEHIEDNILTLLTQKGRRIKGVSSSHHRLKNGDQVNMFIRPEAISIINASIENQNITNNTNEYEGIISDIQFDGARSQIQVDIHNGEPINVSLPQTGHLPRLKRGASVRLHWKESQCICFPYNSGIKTSLDNLNEERT